MSISCSAGRDEIPLDFLFLSFLFSGGIGKRSSAGCDRKVPEYTELLRNSSGKYNLGYILLTLGYPSLCG